MAWMHERLSATLLRVNGHRYALALTPWLLAMGCGNDGGARPAPDGSAGSLGGDGVIAGMGGSGGTGGAAANAGSGTGGTLASAGTGAGRGGSTNTMAGGAGMQSEGGAPAAGQSGTNGEGGTGERAGSENAGTSAGGNSGSPAECGLCAAYAEPTEVGTVNVSGLDALSGVAVSRTQPDIMLAHNDHDRPVVYALDFQGLEHARFTLDDAAANDIEDIAVGPCGAGTCVYLGDIGDNNAQRSEYAVLRFALPMVPATPGSTALTPDFSRFRFTYEDGSHNAEGLMVGPDGSVYVVTKLASGSGGPVAATGPSSIYRLPAEMTEDSVATAVKVATLTVPADDDLAASAVAAHPCGLGFLLRTYDKVYEFTTPAGMDFEASFTTTPKVVGMPDEPQSEGIDYRADGHGFITSGEGSGAPILETDCTP